MAPSPIGDIDERLVSRKAHPSPKYALVFCALVAVFGLIANKVFPLGAVPFLLSCLLLPWLDRHIDHDRLRETLRPGRSGWILSVILASIYVIGPFLFLYGITRWYLHALFLNPGTGTFFALISKGMWSYLPVAVAEEFFFRGYIQETVFSNRWGDHRVGPFYSRNLMASGLFALTHVITFFSPTKLFIFFGAMIVGRVIIQSRRSIWPGVFLHAFANAANEWLRLLYRTNLPWL